jgi:large subunit ribosomal protein L17
MKKRIAFRKLGRTSTHKWAMLRNMATSLIEHERIVTTVPKAKELQKMADHLITLAKRGEIHHRQQANALLRTKPTLTKLFEVLGPRYKERDGGYTRILKLARPRVGDKADMAVMEYVDRPGELRAARPPASKQMKVLAGVLKQVGITPLEEMEEAEIVELSKSVETMNMSHVQHKERKVEGQDIKETTSRSAEEPKK